MAWRSTAPLATLAARRGGASRSRSRTRRPRTSPPPRSSSPSYPSRSARTCPAAARRPDSSVWARWSSSSRRSAPTRRWATSIFPVVLFAGCWALGRVGRGRARLTAELRARTEQLERERAERERDAVARERVRIARELHDVVAHSVSVMVVQAGAARSVLDRDPDASVRALGAVEATGREALTEMRRLLGILRPDGEDADALPAAVARSPRRAHRPLARRRARRRAARRGAGRAAGARRGPDRVPPRAGGPDQRAQARRPRAGAGRPALVGGGARGRGRQPHRRRPAPSTGSRAAGRG